jgi:hypothetical protein
MGSGQFHLYGNRVYQHLTATSTLYIKVTGARASSPSKEVRS